MDISLYWTKWSVLLVTTKEDFRLLINFVQVLHHIRCPILVKGGTWGSYLWGKNAGGRSTPILSWFKSIRLDLCTWFQVIFWYDYFVFFVVIYNYDSEFFFAYLVSIIISWFETQKQMLKQEATRTHMEWSHTPITMVERLCPSWRQEHWLHMADQW